MVSPLEIAGIGWAVSPIIRFMVDKTLGYLKKPLKRTYGMGADLEKLKQILPEIQAVVSVAETLKVVNPHQLNLLRKMKEAVYDAEDVVDEFNYRLLEAEAAKEEDSVAEKLGAMFLTAGKRLVGAEPLQTSLSKAIKGLEGVDKTAKAFIRACNLEKTADQGQSSRPQQAHTANDRVTTSMKHENKFVGRDADIKNIVDKIKEQADCSSAPPLVISVVGVGGIGKTTLAQWVYSHQEIASNVFDVKMWVFVENTFNFDTVTKLVLAKIKGKNIDCDNLDTAQNEISELLDSKKFLLVLDDVWVDEKKDENKFNNRETWKKFFSTFHKCKGGSSIIVTTRLASVVNMIGDCIKFDLKGLSKEDSEELFMSHAFPERVGKSTELEAVGKDIAEKLKGLPLALKVVGMQLKGNHSIKDWKNVLRNTVSTAGNVMDILKLSYDHLPSHLKPCFGYCSLFPKGYLFTENEIKQLIHMWIAQGLIYNMDGSNDGLEDIGQSYFDNLCSRSFFQPAEGWYMPTSYYVMHDLINDLAQFVSREECWQIQSHQSNSPSTLLRHVSVSSTDLHVLSKKIKLDKLRTLLVLNRSERHVCTPMEDVILSSLKGARVLDLSGCCIEKLPETIEQMIHLRYLAFDSTSTLLPETCSRLFNLQVVCMTGYRSETRGGIICKKGLDGCAPKNMSSLNNLSHVYVLNGYPVEITGHWKIPQFHGNAVFTLNLDNKLEDIHDIGFQGNLAIQKLENAGSKHDDLKPVICQNELMKELKLEWSLSAPVCRNDDHDLLEVLIPPSNLSSLEVSGYRGSMFPFWLKNNYLTNLSSLCLRNCSELRELPPLGQLPRLQKLELSELNAVEEISLELYGTKKDFGFPSLKRLFLQEMQNLVEWSMPECRPLFPLLEEVYIKECYKLRRVPNIFPVTEDLKLLCIDGNTFQFAFVSCAPTDSSGGRDIVEKIREMIWRNNRKGPFWSELGSYLIWKVTYFSGLKFVFCDIKSIFELRTCKLEILDFHRDFHNHPQAVKDLYLHNCTQLLSKVGLTKLSSLETLSIEENTNWMLGGLQEDVILDLQHSRGLKVLHIMYCTGKLKLINCYALTSLKELVIDYCPELIIDPADFSFLTSVHNLKVKLNGWARLLYEGFLFFTIDLYPPLHQPSRPKTPIESDPFKSRVFTKLFLDVELDRLGPAGSSLYHWIIAHGTIECKLQFYPPYDLFSTYSEIVITYDDIKDIMKMSWLNVSVIQLYMMKLYNVCQKENIQNIGFMDPARINATYWGKEKQSTITYIAETMQPQQTILAPYFEDHHWVLLVIKPSEGTVYVLDSLNNRRDKNYVIKDAFAQAMRGATLYWITGYPSPQQIGGFECGYYVMNLMQDIITNREFPKGSLRQNYTKPKIDSVRRSWIKFFLELLHAKAFRSDYQQSRELPIAAEEVEEGDESESRDEPASSTDESESDSQDQELSHGAKEDKEEGGNEVQEAKREGKAESRNSDCSIDEIAKGKGFLSLSSYQPSTPEKQRMSDASVSHTRKDRFKYVEHDRLGPGGLSLHDWIVAHRTSERTLEFQPPLDLFGTDNKIVITRNDINDLKEVDCLNVSVIQLYMMKLYNICAKENIQNISFLDPARINATQLSTEKHVAVTYMAETKQSQQTILAPYFENHHWVLLVIKPSEETVYVLDSLSNTTVKNYVIKDALMQAFSSNMHWIIHPSPQQNGGFECGYYVMILMQDIITKYREFPKGNLPQNYTDPEIGSVRRSWIKFFLEEAQQKIEFDKHEALRNDEFKREMEQALLESTEP